MENVKFQAGVHKTKDARLTFSGTPFLAKTSTMNGNALWMRWGNYVVVDSFTNPASELKTLRTSGAIFDMSPLAKYLISGSDAEKMLDRLIPRDIAKLRVGQIYYSPWCTEEGKIIGDGLIIRESETSFMISADPGLIWWTSNAKGLEVKVTDETDNFGILALQGPKSRDALAAAAEEEFVELPFSRLGWLTLAGQKMRVIRQGFTGEHGYEIWVPRAHGPSVWEAVATAGAHFGIEPAGSWAQDIARIEAGLFITGYDYTSAGPDEGAAGVFASKEYQVTPFDLGLDRLIDFNSGDFIGKQALQVIKETKTYSKLCGVDIDWRKLESDEPSNLLRVKWYPAKAVKDGQEIGRITSIVWSPTIRRLVGFAHLERDKVSEGDQVVLRWDKKHSAKETTATIRSLPFYKLTRSST